ncbi:MAG: aldo/keto reductase [Bryobacterales bacterium]|nr:aldo/keto reductase [Bryobacterales bacterium]
MPFQSRILGSTGLSVGPIGLSSSYGMPAAAVEEAFDRGMNYLYWGSLRRDSFAQGVRNRLAHRDKMVLVVQSFSRFPRLIEWSVDRALRKLGTDYADVLLLGYWNQPVSARVLDASLAVKAKGKVRFLALSTHQTQLAGAAARGGPFDIVHFRYNAAHREAERDTLSTAPRQSPGLVAYTATCWSRLLNAKVPGERAPTAGDCYRFVLSHPSVDLCMNGAASLEEARHALACLEKGPMSEDELAWMRRIGDSLR